MPFSIFVRVDVYHIDDLLVAAVGIKDYGEMDNKNLSKRFDVPEKLPSIKMFQNGDVTKWLDYSDGKGFFFKLWNSNCVQSFHSAHSFVIIL